LGNPPATAHAPISTEPPYVASAATGAGFDGQQWASVLRITAIVSRTYQHGHSRLASALAQSGCFPLRLV